MIFAFTIGIIVCLVIAEKYTEPIKRIAMASRKIAMESSSRSGKRTARMRSVPW